MQHHTAASLQSNDHADAFDAFDGPDSFEGHHYARPLRADGFGWDEGGCFEPDTDFGEDLPWDDAGPFGPDTTEDIPSSPACAACGVTAGAMGTYQGEPLCHACHLDELSHDAVARDAFAHDE